MLWFEFDLYVICLIKLVYLNFNIFSIGVASLIFEFAAFIRRK